MFEVAGTVDAFYTAVRHTEGLEWLAESDDLTSHEPDDDFATVDSLGQEEPSTYSTRLYLVVANATALQRLTDLWAFHETVERGEDEWPRGFTRWGDVFRLLREIRRWGPRDRLLDTGLLDVWAENLAAGRDIVPVEIELWFRDDAARRVEAEDTLRRVVLEQQGGVVSAAIIPEIRYHAILAEVPAATAQRIVEGAETDLSAERTVMFLRPTGQFSSPAAPGTDATEDPVGVSTWEGSLREPIRIALLDGLPLENHARLAGRVIVDDPDGWSEDYPASLRRHGTAMASLILNDDLENPDGATGEGLYVRPILRPDLGTLDSRETVPGRELVVDLVHRAVRRMLEGDTGLPASAPTVRIINFSIGDPHQLFDTLVSPMARLLDWMACKYNVLFVVSAGNHAGVALMLEHGTTLAADLQPEERDRLLLESIWNTSRARRLLAPAESLNALTVASLNEDRYVGAPPPRSYDYFSTGTFPSPLNALGFGIQRALKPDVLAPGGRVVLELPLVSPDPTCTTLEPKPYLRPPGLAHAYPGQAGELDRTAYSDGTSNAAATVTRLAGRVYRMLEDPLAGSDEAAPDTHRTVLTKTLVAHSSIRPNGLTSIRRMLVAQGRSRTVREDVSRFLGNGAVQEHRALSAADERITLIGWGTLNAEEAEVYEIPLPPSLSGINGWRRLTITLAWFSPVNPRNRRYRQAYLWFESLDDLDDAVSVERAEATQALVRRGTLQHEVFEGQAAAAFVDGAILRLKVNCRADAGPFQSAVPYGVAVSLEIAPQLQLPLYDEVTVRLQARIQARVE